MAVTKIKKDNVWIPIHNMKGNPGPIGPQGQSVIFTNMTNVDGNTTYIPLSTLNGDVKIGDTIAAVTYYRYFICFTVESIDEINANVKLGYYIDLTGSQGPTGPQGEDGFSPTITVNTNTDTEYKLDIIDKTGIMTTPNLKATADSGTNITYIDDNTAENPFVLGDNEPGIYIFATTDSTQKIYLKAFEDKEALNFPFFNNGILYVIKKIEATDDINTTVAYFINEYLNPVRIFASPSTVTTGIYYQTLSALRNVSLKNLDEYITGLKNFATLPESSITPTTDNQLVNKKYVDNIIEDKITSELESEI